MSAPALPERRINPFARMLAQWLDGDGSRAILILLAVFVPVWTAFHIITYAGIGLNPDLTEFYSWGRHPLPGYYKHPPLGALMSAAWFAIFPVRDWSFDLLAMVNAALALYVIDLIARRYLSGDKRLMVPLLLLMTPFYQFHAQRFGANQALLATWPLAVYCFLRAFESRTATWSIAAGACAALAMLGKYYSIYLIAGIAIAALTHPQAWRYLKSPSPWISILAGLAVLAPHVAWLLGNDFLPFHYAYSLHAGSTSGLIARGIVHYLGGGVAFVALPIAVYLLAVRPSRRALMETLWPRDPDRRMLVVMLAAFLLLPPISAPFAGLTLSSLWTMEMWFLLPIILLAPASVRWPRRASFFVAGAVLVFSLLAVVFVAPVLAANNFNKPDADGRLYYRQIGDTITRAWHARFHRPLTIVLGNAALADAVTFYGSDHPDSVPYFEIKYAPWVTPARLSREGWAAICRADDTECLNDVASFAGRDRRLQRSEIEVMPHLLGFSSVPARFVVFLMPPREVASLNMPADNPIR